MQKKDTFLTSLNISFCQTSYESLDDIRENKKLVSNLWPTYNIEATKCSHFGQKGEENVILFLKIINHYFIVSKLLTNPDSLTSCQINRFWNISAHLCQHSWINWSIIVVWRLCNTVFERILFLVVRDKFCNGFCCYPRSRVAQRLRITFLLRVFFFRIVSMPILLSIINYVLHDTDLHRFLLISRLLSFYHRRFLQ